MTLSRRCARLLAKARRNPVGLRFPDATRLADCLGLVLRRVSGSHFLYESSTHLANLQPRKDGKAKAYQVRQLLKIADAMANGDETPS